MKIVFLALIVLAAGPCSAGAATCSEGIEIIGQMSKVLALSEIEQSNIDALITKAKIEEEQGRQRNCKIILADAIRFFIIKTVLE